MGLGPQRESTPGVGRRLRDAGAWRCGGVQNGARAPGTRPGGHRQVSQTATEPAMSGRRVLMWVKSLEVVAFPVCGAG